MKTELENQHAVSLVGPGFIEECGLSVEHGGVVAALIEKDEVSPLDWLVLRDFLTMIDCNDEALALLIILTLDSLNKGSLCLRLDQESLEQATHGLAGKPYPDLCRRILDEMALVSARKSRWSELIGTAPDSYTPMILQGRGTQFIYFQKNLINCLALQDQLVRRVNQPASLIAPEPTVASLIQAVNSSQDYPLNTQQLLAVAVAMLKPFSVISGGPGTGKTSAIAALLRCFVQCGVSVDDIAAVAPTGRAAQRMTEAIQRLVPGGLPEPERTLVELEATTIHSLLRYSPKVNGFVHNRENPLPHRLVIVDEVSMVDVGLMTALLDALKDDARLLFLGDKDQLPSVEAGAVLAELIPPASQTGFSTSFGALLERLVPGLDVPVTDGAEGGLRDCTVVLTKSYRSEKSILEVADKINRCDQAVVKDINPLPMAGGAMDDSNLTEGVYMIETPTEDLAPLQQVLDRWAVNRYVRDTTKDGWLGLLNSVTQCDLSKLPDAGTDDDKATLDGLFNLQAQGQILTLVRHGMFGVNGINQYLGAQIQRLTDPDATTSYFHGQPIIIQRNDRQLGLFNGDLGIVLKDKSGFYRAVFPRLSGFVAFAMDDLPPYEGAFAITIHKSQGSEYERVLLVLPKNVDNPLLSKEIMYTGVTRAKQVVMIAGREAILKTAVGRSVQRESGVDLWQEEGEENDQLASDFSDLPLFQ